MNRDIALLVQWLPEESEQETKVKVLIEFLLGHAEQDLKCAVHLYRLCNPLKPSYRLGRSHLLDNICFLSHQSVEKRMKALLHTENLLSPPIKTPQTHSLQYLFDLAVPIISDLQRIRSFLEEVENRTLAQNICLWLRYGDGENMPYIDNAITKAFMTAAFRTRWLIHSHLKQRSQSYLEGTR